MLRSIAISLLTLISISLLTVGCDQQTASTPAVEAPSQVEDDRVPPQPPLNETFDVAPQLSLFPRVGDYRPETDEERFPFWKTFIDHFTKVSGLLKDPESENKAWSFRSINTIDSVAYFSPLGVEPNTTYRVSYKVKTELPEGGKTGIGILEFSEFLWIGEQYTEEQTKQFQVGAQMGIELTGDIDWEEHSFTLTTRPETKMIHLIFFREGEHNRKPVLIDDISIEQVDNNLK